MAWLTKLQEAVKNQTGKVFQQMSPAEQEQAQERAEKWKKEQATAQQQASENQASEIQPADHPAVQASGAAEQPRDKMPVSLLVQRHGMLIERQARVAQMLEEARAQLPATQDQQSTRAPAHAPGTVQPLTLPTSPGVSARSSPSTPSGQPMSPTRPESAASDTVSAHLPQAPLQESPARLQRQGSESGQDTRELDRSRQPRHASEGQITEVPMGGGPSSPAHLDTRDAAEEGKGPPLARYQTPEKLADRQVRPSDIDTPDAPAHPEKTPAPPTSPATPSSPSSLVAPRAHAGSSAAAGAATTDQPVDAQQESRARLQRQAGELRRTIQGLAGPLEAVREEARQVGRQLGAVETQIKLNDDAITEVLRKKGFHAQAPLDKEDSRLHLEKAELEQRARQLARSEDTLTALLAPARRDLEKIEQQLAGPNRRTSHAASPRAPHPTPSSRSQSSDSHLLQAALPDGGSAVARLVERAARRSPRALGGWLRLPSFKGPPKPLAGKRQAAFMQLVRNDVEKVARQGGIQLTQAAALMFDAVDREALGATLSHADKEHLLDTLDKLGAELAAAQPQAGIRPS